VYTRGTTQLYEEDQVVVRVTDEVDLVETIGSGSVSYVPAIVRWTPFYIFGASCAYSHRLV